MSMRHCKIDEVEIICEHAQWHKHHVFGWSRILLDTGLFYCKSKFFFGKCRCFVLLLYSSYKPYYIFGRNTDKNKDKFIGL